MSVRPSPLSGSTSTSRRNFPSSRSNGVASPGLQARTVGSTAAATESYVAPQRKKAGPTLALGAAAASGGSNGVEATGLHPLKYTWDVWFSQRQGTGKGGKKDAEGKAASGQKEKESREDWEGAVVKLGGFSTVSQIPTTSRSRAVVLTRRRTD